MKCNSVDFFINYFDVSYSSYQLSGTFHSLLVSSFISSHPARYQTPRHHSHTCMFPFLYRVSCWASAHWLRTVRQYSPIIRVREEQEHAPLPSGGSNTSPPPSWRAVVAHLSESGIQYSHIRLFVSISCHCVICKCGIPRSIYLAVEPSQAWLCSLGRAMLCAIRLPATLYLLHLLLLLAVWDFFGFLRVREFTVWSHSSVSPVGVPTIHDVAEDTNNPPSFICLHLHYSKTYLFK